MNLKSMPLAELTSLHEQVAATLSDKVKTSRQELEAEPAKLGGPARGSTARRPLGPAAPKFHDPETGLTWAGRGLQPKWMTAAIKGGKKREDFAVSAPAKSNGRRKGRKA